MEFLAELHPKIVHFPIALLMLYPVLELIALITSKDFFSKFALLFLSTGVFFSLLAVLSGNQALNELINRNKELTSLFESHQLYANLTVWYFTALLFIRLYVTIKKKLNNKFLVVFLVLGLLGSYFVFKTGDYGGKLAEKVSINSIK